MQPRKRKALGQHFLRDPRVAERIVAAAALQPGERVLEIGPGGGAITNLLAGAVGVDGGVVAIEADRRFAQLLRPAVAAHVEVVDGDALEADLEALGPFDAVVANLPYQISGPVTFRLLDVQHATGWSRAVLMYQREFAARLAADAGSKAYGRLSVHVARACAVEKVLDVAPGAFDPPPKVASTVVRLTPHASPPFTVADEDLWRRTVDSTFQQRRKQMRNTLPGAIADRVHPEQALAILDRLGLAGARPEQVTPAGFAGLVAELAQKAVD